MLQRTNKGQLAESRRMRTVFLPLPHGDTRRSHRTTKHQACPELTTNGSATSARSDDGFCPDGTAPSRGTVAELKDRHVEKQGKIDRQ